MLKGFLSTYRMLRMYKLELTQDKKESFQSEESEMLSFILITNVTCIFFQRQLWV